MKWWQGWGCAAIAALPESEKGRKKYEKRLAKRERDARIISWFIR